MVVVSYSGKEINAKLVYYGAGLSGKTTNLEAIYEAVPDTSRGKMVSMKTQSDRTLFFDLLPLDLGEIMGFNAELAASPSGVSEAAASAREIPVERYRVFGVVACAPPSESRLRFWSFFTSTPSRLASTCCSADLGGTIW